MLISHLTKLFCKGSFLRRLGVSGYEAVQMMWYVLSLAQRWKNSEARYKRKIYPLKYVMLMFIGLCV